MSDVDPHDTADVDVPDVASFDRKRIRRMVWRGVARTATVALVLLLGLNLLVPLASKGWQNRGNHDVRFFDVVSKAYLATHPGYRIEGSSCCSPGRRFDLRFELGLEPPSTGSEEQNVEVVVRQDFRGHASVLAGPEDEGALGIQAFMVGQITKEDTARLLSGLPPAVTTVALVEFNQPLSLPENVAFERDVSLSGGTPRTVILTPIGRLEDRPYVFSWPSSDLDDLAPWARRLRPHDQRNVFSYTIDQIKQMAAHPQIHALLLERTPARSLLPLLQRLDVRAVKLIKVGFETDPSRVRPS